VFLNGFALVLRRLDSRRYEMLLLLAWGRKRGFRATFSPLASAVPSRADHVRMCVRLATLESFMQVSPLVVCEFVPGGLGVRWDEEGREGGQGPAP
jgi:hypothetical protein